MDASSGMSKRVWEWFTVLLKYFLFPLVGTLAAIWIAWSVTAPLEAIRKEVAQQQMSFDQKISAHQASLKHVGEQLEEVRLVFIDFLLGRTSDHRDLVRRLADIKPSALILGAKSFVSGDLTTAYTDWWIPAARRGDAESKYAAFAAAQRLVNTANLRNPGKVDEQRVVGALEGFIKGPKFDPSDPKYQELMQTLQLGGQVVPSLDRGMIDGRG